MCNLVASYCNDWSCVDVFGINKIPIIVIFVNVPFTRGSGVTLTLNFADAGASPPPISLCPSININIDSLVKCHAFDGDEGGMRGG